MTTAETEALPEDLADLLDAVAVELDRYVYFTSIHHAPAIALFAAYTHAFEAFDIAPYLHIHSPEPQCGKSLLLDVLECLVAVPLATGNITSAAMFRALEDRRGTLLWDEVDRVFLGGRSQDPKTAELQGILNTGYRRGNPVLRMGGAKYQEIEEFDAFGPKVLAGIGRLPATVADRCIPIRLQRKPPGITKHRFRSRVDRPKLLSYESQLAKVMASDDLVTRLSLSWPHLPEVLGDRAQDIWEPLLSLAEEAGGDWTERARKCASALQNGREESEGSIGIQLLHDIKKIWSGDQQAMTSSDIRARLLQLEEAPWREWSGGPITLRFLATHLRPLRDLLREQTNRR